MTLLTLFSRLEDPRCGPAKRYDLSEVVGMAHCADDWEAVEDSCEDDEAWRKTFLPLTNGTPSHDTFGNVFRVLDPAVVESCFREWICGRVGVVRDIIALDSRCYLSRRRLPCAKGTLMHVIWPFYAKSC